MATRVVNIRALPPTAYDVYVGRAGQGQNGYFGNPHIVDMPCPICSAGWAETKTSQTVIHSRESAIRAFETYFHARVESDADYRKAVLALKNRTLGCFCAPRSCHADVIAEWLDQQEASP